MYPDRRTSQRQSYNYNYSGPTTSQYESFFEPIPLEFVQQQFDRRQGKYDTAYASALEAKDLYAGAEVADTDIVNKNNLVQRFTGDMDEMVKERYGGDWGRAAKEVARHVTDMRTNSFWDTTNVLKQRQAEERALRAQYGNDALIFNSVLDKSSIDPETGKVLSADQFNYDIKQRGDWAGSIDEILSRMKPNTNTWGLTKADFGHLKSGNTTYISEDGIRKLSQDPSVQQAILSANPDMSEAFERLPGERSKWFGSNYEDDQLSTAIGDLIMGRGRSMVFSQSNDQYHKDWEYERKIEQSRRKTDENPYFTSFTRQSTNPVATVAREAELANLRRMRRPGILGQHVDRRNAYHAELVRKYPELKDMDQKEAFDAYEAYLTKTREELELASNIKLAESSNNVKLHMLSNLDALEFYLEDDLEPQSWEDIIGRSNLNTNYKSFEELVTNPNLLPKINFSEGKLSLTINNDDKLMEIFFDGDEQTKVMLQGAQKITELYYNPTTYTESNYEPPLPLYDHEGNPTGQAVTVIGTGSITGENNKTIWLFDLENKTKRPIPIDYYYELVTAAVDNRFNLYRGKTGNPGQTVNN